MGRLGIIVATDDEFKVVYEELLSNCIDSYELQVNTFQKQVHFVLPEFYHPERYNVILMQSGIGKVNAAIAATYLKLDGNCTSILNIGSAGTSTSIDIGNLVLVKNCVQHDVDVTEFGYSLGQIPNQEQYTITSISTNNLIKKELELLGIDYGHFDIGTGDSFINYSEYESRGLGELGVELLDMETAAINSACNTMNIPFSSIRIISDNLDDNEYKEYNENILNKYKGTYISIIKRLLKGE